MDSGPPRLPRRNVEVFDSDGGIIAGFWQYGTLQWDEFYRYIKAFTVTTTAWTIFEYDVAQQQHGDPCSPGAQIVQPGHYILLSETGGPIRVGLVPTSPRPRSLSYSHTPASKPHYRTRGLLRDCKCLITGLETDIYNSRLGVAHIFPRAHELEWTRKGYPSKITDTADEAVMGGKSKLDSVQNLITIRRDLHASWNVYEFGVDPNNNYRITSFVNCNDINGKYLQLDHIQDPTLRPLDELFDDHFMQGLLRYMKGTGEEGWTYEDYDDVFVDGSSLSNPKDLGN